MAQIESRRGVVPEYQRFFAETIEALQRESEGRNVVIARPPQMEAHSWGANMHWAELARTVHTLENNRYKPFPQHHICSARAFLRMFGCTARRSRVRHHETHAQQRTRRYNVVNE